MEAEWLQYMAHTIWEPQGRWFVSRLGKPFPKEKIVNLSNIMSFTQLLDAYRPYTSDVLQLALILGELSLVVWHNNDNTTTNDC